MRWIEVDTYQEMSLKAADCFEQQLLQKPDSVLGLATGGSPIGFYEEFVKRYKQRVFSFSQVKTFNLDEYVGVSPADVTSYHSYMEKHLFSQVDIEKNDIHIPNGLAPNLQEECVRYEQSILQSGGIDLQLLGIGVNGHIGFNEPGTSFQSKTHVVTLAEDTRAANSIYFSSKQEVPEYAISMGIETIMQAKKIILLAFGEQKMRAIERLKQESISEDFPASRLKEHPNVTIIYGR
ncbi:glucosamine-6-phosphate deaminase [Psychrobacillus sp. NPDC093180]|uniref:glucosamine-6-phosphate deaminase n=1 Tax=Psychrobacillus sp. NPDC093180 TaxID=3364489 RepID=UPI00380A6C52